MVPGIIEIVIVGAIVLVPLAALAGLAFVLLSKKK